MPNTPPDIFPDGVEMRPLDKAKEILGMDPLPEDAEAQVDALREIAPADEKPFFDWIYEGLFVDRNAKR